jgi:glycosyltransferase involved in cell wall biosynthesis
MRVLLATSIFPPDIGGPATHTTLLASALIARGLDVTVFTLSDATGDTTTAVPYSVVRLRRRMWKPLRWIRTVGQLVRLARRADVVFVNGLAMEAALAKCVTQKPIVLRVPGDLAWERASDRGWISDGCETFQRKRYGARIEVLRWMRSWWTRRADHVIVPSRYLRGVVAGWGVAPERITVVSNGVESIREVQETADATIKRCELVAVGRLVPWKRVDGILRVVARLDGIRLNVVGDGAERPRLEELASRLGIGDRVLFSGARNRATTLALVRAAEVLVLNSMCETFSFVLAEAMALGVPVVATAVGAVPEMVRDGHNGRLVPSGDEETLTETLRLLLASESERQRLAKAGLDTALEFGVERMVDDTEAVLRRMAP